MYGLNGRTAIVTGAAHGIGRGIAARLLDEGCTVGILDIDPAAADATAQALSAKGKVVVASGDVSSKASVQAAIGRLIQELGEIDILVNNAGICRVGKLLETSDEDWKATFGINLDGVFHVTREVAPRMVARGSGSIVNLASWMGKSGVAAYGAYCASKFAIVALTQTLACELGGMV